MTLHADAGALAQLQTGPAKVVAVKAEEYDDEFLSLDLNVKIVSDLDDAIAHIREHGTQHSDAIPDPRYAQRPAFLLTKWIRPLFTLTPLRVLPTAVSLDWVRKWR